MNNIRNYIKSMFYPTVIETPNSPPTFNLNQEQLKEVQDILDQEDSKSVKIEDLIATSSKVKIEDINARDESSPTLNFNHEQMKDINAILDKGEVLDQETQDKLDQDFETILGPDLFPEFEAEIQQINDQFAQELQEIFTNLF